jgi:hypothetical protein
MVGSRLSTIAFPMLILAITGSAVTAGFALFFVTAPSILVYIPAGALVDRWNPRWTMLASESGRGVAIAIILALLALHRPNVSAIVCCAMAEEILEVFVTLAERRYVTALAGPDLSSSVVMRTEARTHAVVLVGRPLGGLLFEIRSLLPFAADAITFVVSIASLLGLPDVTPPRRSSADLRQIGREIRDGLCFLLGDFRSRVTIALRTPMTLVAQALIMIFIVEAHGRHMSAIEVGSVLACSGIGGFLGALVGPRLRITGENSIVKIQLLTWGISLLLLSISGRSSWQIYCMAGVMILFGFTGAMGNVEFDAYLSVRAPDMVGRLTAIERLTSFAASAIGPVAGGILAQECGYQVAEFLLFILIADVGLLSLPVIWARNRASRGEHASPPTPRGPSTGHQSQASLAAEFRHPEDAPGYRYGDRPAALGGGAKSSARQRVACRRQTGSWESHHQLGTLHRGSPIPRPDNDYRRRAGEGTLR